MSTTLEEKNEAAAVAQVDRQLVALHLAEEVYGVDIALIHTVIMPQSITQVPQTPKYVKGVMNLRGQILPVIDLRTRFGLPPADTEAKTRIVIVNVGDVTAGMVVDAVTEVLRLPETSIEAPSGLLSSSASDCITGIGRVSSETKGASAKVKEHLILLLDVLKVLTSTVTDSTFVSKSNAAVENAAKKHAADAAKTSGETSKKAKAA